MKDQTELEEIVVRAQTGDQDAYQSIVERFQAMALAYAYSVLGDYELAEDARQESFIAAYCDLYNLRDPAAFPGWFRRIVHNHSVQFLRRRRLLTVPLDDAGPLASAQPSAAETISRNDQSAQVARAIAQLPAAEAEAVRLFYLEDLSLKEISQRLALPVKTVNCRLHAGRARLRQRLVEMVKDSVRKQYQSGDRRPRQAASVAAIELFDRQLEALLKSPTERRLQQAEEQREAAEIYCARGRLLRFMGRHEEALSSFRQALTLPQLRRDAACRGRLRAELGITHLQTADYATARKELAAARKLAESDDGQPNALQAVILNGLGVVAWGEGDFKRARRFYEASLEASRAIACAELEAEVQNNLALLHWKDGELDLALASFRASLGHWKRLKNRFGHAATLMNIGIIEEARGRGGLARRHYQDSLALAEEINFTQVRAAVSCNLGNLEMVQKHWPQALDFNRQALQVAQETGDRRSEAIALENLALTYLGLGQAQESQKALTDARRIARSIGDEERLFSLDLVEIESLLDQNEPQAVSERLERLHEVLEKKGYRAEFPRLLRLLVLAQALGGQTRAAKKTLAKALRECQLQRNRVEELRLLAVEKQLRND